MAGMDNEPKKISFGFNRSVRKPNIIQKQPIEDKKIQLIECVEEKSIKIIGGQDEKTKEPLVIPMKQPNKKLVNLIDIVKNNFNDSGHIENNGTNTDNAKTEDINTENLNLEEQAARELLNETDNIKNKAESKLVIDTASATQASDVQLENQSTIEDYENIPIEEFGKAMLRGMGWKDGQGIGKNQQLIKMTLPIQRPKGMGLGADKMTKQDSIEKPAVDRDGNILKCVKGAYVKVIAGYHKANYGQIIGFDEESGRLIIKMALNNLNVSLNEFLVAPVTKDDFTKNSKVLNNLKYEEYLKKKEFEEKQKLNIVEIKEETRNNSDEDRKKRKIKEEGNSSDSDVEFINIKKEKRVKEIRKESKSSENKNEGRNYQKDKSELYRIKKERISNDNDSEENNESRKNKYENSKYDNYYKKIESKEKKYKDEHKQVKSKHSSEKSDSDREVYRHKKKSSKHDLENYSSKYERHHRKKHIKTKKYNSDDSSDEKYSKKSKKNERHFDSDSEHEETNRYKKSQNKDKYKHKRDKFRYEKKSSR